MRSVRLLRLGVVLALLGVAAPGAAASPLHGEVVADGKRWAAWSPGPGSAIVLDGRTGTRRQLGIPDCPIGGIGEGLLVLSCPNAARYSPDPVLVDVRTGEQTNVGGDDLRADTLDSYSFTGVGARGILVTVDGYHYRDEFAFDWRSRSRFHLDDPDRTVDLGRAGLTRPLCAPLRRAPKPQIEGSPYDEEPLYLPMSVSGRRAVDVAAERADGPWKVRLWRCGHRRPRLLGRGGEASIGAGLVTWHGGDRARAFEIGTGRRRSWRLPAGDHPRVSQAGRTLLLWTQRSTVDDPPAKLRIVRWPARRG